MKPGPSASFAGTAGRMADIAPSATLALTAKAKALKSQGKPVVSLAAGEPDFGVPEAVSEAMARALREGFTRYTPTSGTQELKAAVCRKFKKDQGLDADSSQVVISCGAKHSLYNLLQVLINPADEVILPKPYWVSYPEMIKLAQGRPVPVDTSSSGYRLTAPLIERAITPKTKVVILNSPSNPTGAVLSPDEIRDVALLVRKKGLFLISDEIYEYYVYDGQKHASPAQFIPDWASHIAVVNGASKAYAMTGLRIGYTLARPEIARAMGILQDHSTSNPDSISQRGAEAALGLGPGYYEDLRRSFEKKRDLMMELLSAAPRIKAIRPGGAFYVFASIAGAGMKPASFCDRLLEERFVAVIPGESFGAPDSVRLSFAASEADIREGISRISRWLLGV